MEKSNTHLTFEYFIYMVPQYKPESVLILSKNGGKIFKLITLLYGNIKIKVLTKINRESVKKLSKFDTVIVDLKDDYVFSKEFVLSIGKKTNYIIVNNTDNDVSEYCVYRKIGTNKPYGLDNIIHYYMVNEIPDVHPYRDFKPSISTNFREDPLSVYPPTKYLTFGCWVYMVPPYKPKSVLMLGYADGTVAGLIRLLYGDVPITGVDIEPLVDNKYGVNFVHMDAQEYVKTSKHFDTVIIDMFPGESSDLCGFITKKEFADKLIKIADYIIINTLREPDLSAYSHLRKIGVNKPSGLSNLIYYFQVNGIPNLPPNNI